MNLPCGGFGCGTGCIGIVGSGFGLGY